MNDRRFKELVNLHLDHRLSDDEALELEQALKADPARRRLLSSYAAMQRGCTVLCRRSSAGAPAPQAILRAIRDAERKVNAPARPAHRVWAWGTWSTAAGLAAVAAVIVIRIERPVGLAAGEAAASPTETLVAANTDATPVPSIESSAPVHSVLPPHLTLAALGISNESREVGVVSKWSHPLDNLTQAEIDRAASWARASTNPEWAVDATATTRLDTNWPNYPATQASTVSFTFDR